MKNENSYNNISVTNLSIGYRTKNSIQPIAEGINFSISSSKMIGIVGANGVGKSTLLRTLSSIQPALSGAVLVNDLPLTSFSIREISKILSVVLTEKIPSKHLEVKEVIALGRQPYTNWLGTLSKEDIKIVKQAIQRVQIDDLLNRRCFQLSDGQLQKVFIARALAQDTPIILLDEPTTHLDIYHKAYIFKLLRKIVDETDKIVIFSTHEIDLAIQLCDQLIVMHEDKVVFDTPKNLIEKGEFSSLFPKDLINFDKEKRYF